MDPDARNNPEAWKPAYQARSADTLERILRAAEVLLDDRDFDQITIAEIASEAGCGVGTVYGRVKDKEHLLFCLHDRLTTRSAERAAQKIGGLSDTGLEERVAAIADLIVTVLRENRGVSRAVTNRLYASSSQAASANMRRFRETTTTMFREAAMFLAEGMPDSTHPETRAACEFALLAAQDVAYGRIVFGTRSGLDLKYTQKELRTRTADLMLRYLSAHTNTTPTE